MPRGPATPFRHGWDVTTSAAKDIQAQGRTRVQIPRVGQGIARWRFVAGVDVSYTRFERECYAAVVVWDRQAGAMVLERSLVTETPFPYVPGLLSFREVPALLPLLSDLKPLPDVFMMDGQGVAHPRRFGLASHLGVWLDRPAVGCAKSRLIGVHDPVGKTAGETVPLRDDGEVIGTVLRNKTRCRPLFVSPGHRVSHADAVALVRACTTRYRLPEPTRLADQLTKKTRRRERG